MNLTRLAKKFNLIVFFIVLFSCKDEEIKNVPIIDAELTVYVNRFLEEAEHRGIAVSLDNSEVKFETLSTSCGNGSPDPPRIKIDPDCWSAQPDIAREILMFHEMGHAILGKSHNNGKLPNGDYKSIMHEDPTTLYNEYTPEKRTYYLDELFDVVTTLPHWTSVKSIESIVLTDEISSSSLWIHSVSGNANHEASIVDSSFSSPSNSLAIHSKGVSTGYSYWVYSWIPEDIEVGSALVLKVKIRSEGLTGGGAFFAFRADINELDYPIFFYTTQGTPVTGTTEFGESEYSIKVNYFPSEVDELKIFLFLDGASSGTVFFDDIQLLKYQ